MIAFLRSDLVLVLLSLIVLLPTTSTADIIYAQSTFDSDLDGWTMTDTGLEWRSTGGNPGGYMDWSDFRTTTNNTEVVDAPAKFLGNWSSLDGVGYIEFDHKLFSTGVGPISPYAVFLSGPGGAASWTSPGPAGATPWVTLRADLVEANWTLSSGSWSDLLSDVSSMRVRIELVGNTQGGDVAGMDNVRLVNAVPEPASGWIALVATASLFFLRQRRISGAPPHCNLPSCHGKSSNR